MGSLDEFRRWVGERRDGPLCVDTESGGLSPHRNRHRLTQIGDMWTGWAFTPGWFGAANEVITGYQGRLGMFNSPYDHRVLQHQDGVTPRWEATDDAQLASHIVDSARVNKLKARSAIEIDPRAVAGERLLSEGMKKQHWTWDTVPVTWEPYWQYGALDPVLTAHLLAKFLPEVISQFGPAYDLELRYAALCAQMMSAGMMIDIPYIHARMAEVEAWTARATSWLRAQWGITSMGSNEQVGAALERAGVPILHRTATGLPTADRDTLAMYAVQFPHAAPLLNTLIAARKGEGITGKYLGKFLAMADGDVMHYSIHSTGAQRTGRSSASDPPMHQFDRQVPYVRGSYIPRPGCAFVTIDADQIEARLAAHFSGDAQLIADFAEADATGASFFLIQAAGIYRQEITKADPRYTTTKNAFYGWQFGAGLETAAATAQVSIEQMRPAYEGIKARYPGVQQMMNRIVRENRRQGHRPQIRTISGKRLYGDRGKEYALQDYKIQGSAADLMKRGGIDLAAAGLGDYLRLSIHDEWLLECPAADAQDVLRTAQRVLTNTTDFRVPLTWSGSILTERWVKT
jgi:DNA polymerase-1